MKKLILLVLFATISFAQGLSIGTSDRSGACPINNFIVANTTNGHYFQCQTGTWALISTAAAQGALSSPISISSGQIATALGFTPVGGNSTVGLVSHSIPISTGAGIIGDSGLICTSTSAITCTFPGTLTGVGNVLGANAVLDPTNANYFTGQSGTNFCQPFATCTVPRSAVTGTANTGGGRALWSVTTGSYNTGYGIDSLGFVSTGNNNTGFGLDTLAWVSIGHENAAIGTNALWSVTTGTNNLGSGYGACYNGTTGSGNLCLGANANFFTPSNASVVYTASSGAGLSVGSYFYNISFLLNAPGASVTETDLSGNAYWGATTTTGNQQIAISNLPLYSGPLICTGRKIYRTNVSQSGASGPARRWYLVATIADNTTTTYTDSTADLSLGSEIVGPSNVGMIGAYASAYKSNQWALGSASSPILELWFNPIWSSGTAYSVLLSGANGTGSNTAGANITLQGGPGTGTAAGGNVLFNYCPAGSSGLTMNSCVAVGGTSSNGWTFNYTNSGTASTPIYITNAASTSGGSVEFRMGVTSNAGANTNGIIGFVNTRQSDGSSNLTITAAPGSASAATTVFTIVGNGGNIIIPAVKSTTGQRYVCATTTGQLVGSASACLGT